MLHCLAQKYKRPQGNQTRFFQDMARPDWRINQEMTGQVHECDNGPTTYEYKRGTINKEEIARYAGGFPIM